MALDKIQIGERIRNIRENTFKETREVFADRCKTTESHIGQIERGVITPSIIALDKIAVNTGESLDYIVYGKKKNDNLRRNIDIFLDRSDPEEIKMYFKCLSTIKGYLCKNK